MNNQEKESFLRVAHKYKSVRINIYTFTVFITDETLRNMADFCTDKDIMKSGLYATIGSTKVYVNKIVPPGYIQFSESDDNTDWSPSLKLDMDLSELDKIVELMVFW